MSNTPKTDAAVAQAEASAKHKGLSGMEFWREMYGAILLHARIAEWQLEQPADAEVLALLRELNDIVWGVIPSDLQARVDAVLDRAEKKP